ncbi:MAG: TetR/AcrR family transcriptional regulator [Clostridia bacterium]|jgi:AcrR family transcriptional regulator|nr:TetR/AcrR family transcriptional regulator [Clostridia bacterium]
MQVNEEDLRVRRTKKLLTEALLGLMQERAFEKISVNDLCDRAMVHRATFYNHFDDKNDLFNYALDEIEEEMLLSTIEKGNFSTSKEMYVSIITRVFDFIEVNRNRFKLIINNNSDRLIMLIATTMRRSVRYFISKNHYSQDYIVPLDIIIDFYMGGLAFIVLDWLQNNEYKKEELIKFFDMMMDEDKFLKNKYN